MGTLYKNGQYWVFSYRENGKNIPISMDGLKGDLSKDQQKKLKRKYET